MKIVKTLLALLACAAVFTFAACSDEEQDVNVVSTVKTSNTYYYSLTGSYVTADTTPVTWTATSSVAYVSWGTGVNSNVQEYDVRIVNLTFKNGDTESPYYSLGIYDLLPGSVYEKDGKYYDDELTDVTSRFTGKVTDDSFTYTYSTTDDGKLTLTFTKL